MADLNSILNTIQSAVYGRDVRQGIYDGIKFIHDEYLTIQDVADKVRELISIYEQAVADAKSLTNELKSLNKTGESLKSDLSDLESTLSDGRDVLAQLKSENTKAEQALTEAREKIPILQDLLSRIPDLDEAERITGELETAYSNAAQALEELNGLSGTIETLTTQNELALQNLAGYESAKTDIEALVQKTTELESVVEGYPDIIQALETAYQNVLDKTVDLDELHNLLNEIDQDVQIINENKESVSIVSLNIEAIKKLSEMDLSGILELESRVDELEKLTPRVEAVEAYETRIEELEGKEDLTPRVEKIEGTLSGLEETLERLI